ncbi:Chromosomal replication initiator protein DnaA [bioreactor metagenome]|uniref:Chromosomal replication initiator protein DnaA n=1 Tax=bioreactor metagenome TaxID=1076179 RepID=A0A645GTR1_9ZZZZ
MYLSRKLLDISLAKIGEDYGGRDHTTVLHACNKIEKDMDNDPDLQKSVMELEKRIKGI